MKTKKRRGHIRFQTLLAAALGQLGGIPHEHRKALTEKQILSLFQRDHDPIPVHIEEINEHWNIQWMLRPDHKFKTAKSDIPMLRKGDRIAAEHQEFINRLLAKSSQADAAPKPKSKWGTRKLQSRGFQRTEKSNATRGRGSR